MSTNLAHFDALTERGLKIIPLWPNSKAPIGKKWNQNWDRAKVREKLQRFPEANLGLLLGEVIDVEGDDEKANQILDDLIGDYPHPCYISTKSKHHLFASPDNKLRHFEWEKMEFRGYGHQSVIPPSQHQGIIYKWTGAFRFPIPPMPEKLLEFYHRKNKKQKDLIKPHHMQVWCGRCEEKCFLHEKRFKLELQAFRIMRMKWECHECRKVDLRPACRLLRAGVPPEIVYLNALQPQL
jgi:hypothetical protein